jgi:hypothetical protein
MGCKFDEAVKTSGYDFSGIGSPYDTKKRTADGGTGAGGENNFAVGKHLAYAKEEQRKPTPFKVPKSEARGEAPKPKPSKAQTAQDQWTGPEGLFVAK